MKKYQYKKDKKSNNFIWLLILTIIILISFLGSAYFKDKSSSFINYLYLPIGYVKEKIAVLKTNSFLVKENKKLILENMNLSIIKEENKELEKEINVLKEQLELKNIYTNYYIVNATVTSRNKNYWFNELTIDKGSNSMIKENMAVVTTKGLIGIISKVYENSSIIKMITNRDSNNKISVSVNNKNGVITNYNSFTNYLEITGFTTYDEVKVGDILITSGLGIFPKGLKIGEVKEIKKDDYEISNILFVNPNQDMNNIEYVCVLGNVRND